MKGKVCANPCGNGWYAQNVNTCAQCLNVCETCTTGTTCATCKPGYVGVNCDPCSAPCMTCSGTPTSCTGCFPGSSYYLQAGGGSCVAAGSCAAGSYAESNNQCMACSTECGTCVDYPDKCLTCSDPTKVWKNYKCLGSCTTGYLPINDICCPDKCTGCDITEACSGCIDGYYLDTSSVCQKCNVNCLTCTTNPTQCLTCNAGDVLQGTVCQPSCNTKFYPVAGVCKNCHVSCKNCHGDTENDCDGCENLYVPWKNKCWSCMNNQTDFESSRFEEKGGRCWEKCGIRGKLSIEEIPEGLAGYKACDDGNQINGDGCSASCTVEKNYNCVGGGIDKADYCYTLLKPSAEILAINNSTEFQIAFTKNIMFKNLSDTSKAPQFPITLEIAKVDKSIYTVKWTQPEGDTISYVNFTISATETIRLGKITVFFERSVIMDEFNNTLTNVKLNTNTTIIVNKHFILEPMMNILQPANKICQFIVPVASLGITNYILQNFIRYVTTFQILGSAMFLNVNQSSSVSYLLSESNSASEKTLPSPSYWMKSKLVVDRNDSYVNPKIKTNLKRVLATTSKNSSNITQQYAKNTSAYAQMFNTESAPWSFRRNGYGNSLVPNLSFAIVVIILTGIWYLFASVFMIGKVTVKSGWCKRFLAFTAERSFYTAMMFGALELSLFSTRNLVSPQFDHIANLLSFLLSFVVFLAILTLPFALYKIANHEILTLWHPEYYDRYGFVYCEFKLNSKLRKCFMSLLMGRVILYGIFVSALADYPLPQTILVFLTHLAYFGTMMKIKPFVSTVMFVTTAIAEAFILISSLCFMISALDNSSKLIGSDSNRELLDFANCCAILLAVFFTIIGIMMMIILKIVQLIRRYRSTKQYSKIAPANPEKAKILAKNEEVEEAAPELKAAELQKSNDGKDEGFLGRDDEKKPDPKVFGQFNFGYFEDDMLDNDEPEDAF